MLKTADKEREKEEEQAKLEEERLKKEKNELRDYMSKCQILNMLFLWVVVQIVEARIGSMVIMF